MNIVKDIKAQGIYLSKKKGQCLLTDMAIMQRISETAEVSDTDLILDIGTGPGHTLAEIVPQAGYYLGIEIDPKCREMAARKAGQWDKAEIMLADILQKKSRLNPEVVSRLKELASEKALQIKIVANLPYHVATPIIMRFLLQTELPISLMTVMVQKEMGLKLTARAGDSGYGAVSALARIFSDSRMVFQVPKSAFFPQPKVESAVLKIIPCSKESLNLTPEDIPGFEQLVKGVFNFRRKRLANAILDSHLTELKKPQILEIITRAGIEPEKAVRDLEPEVFPGLFAGIRKGIA